MQAGYISLSILYVNLGGGFKDFMSGGALNSLHESMLFPRCCWRNPASYAVSAVSAWMKPSCLKRVLLVVRGWDPSGRCNSRKFTRSISRGSLHWFFENPYVTGWVFHPPTNGTPKQLGAFSFMNLKWFWSGSWSFAAFFGDGKSFYGLHSIFIPKKHLRYPSLEPKWPCFDWNFGLVLQGVFPSKIGVHTEFPWFQLAQFFPRPGAQTNQNSCCWSDREPGAIKAV